MKNIFLLLLLVITAIRPVFSQEEPSAAMDIESPDKGILIPRTDTTTVNAAFTPATGLLIFQTTDSRFYFHDGQKWVKINVGENSMGVFENVLDVVRNTGDHDYDDFVFGEADLHSDGNKFFFDKSKSAFRAGESANSYWTEDSLGVHSFAAGYATLSSGNASFAAGQLTRATGNNSVAMGSNSEASRDYSFAMGANTHATAEFASAFGYNSHATGEGSFAVGQVAHAQGDYSFALGNLTTTSGDMAMSVGNSTSAPSFCQSTVGSYNLVLPALSATDWNDNDRLFVIGNGISGSDRSNAMTVLKNGNVGLGTILPQGTLHVKGTSIHEDNLIVGDKNIGTSGVLFYDKSRNAFRSGQFDITPSDSLGKFSFASGRFIKAPSAYEHVFGSYNSTYNPVSRNSWNDDDRLFVVGNGTSSSHRKNALTILKNGSLGINTSIPNSSAILDIRSDEKGILIPRMTSLQRMSIPSPANALLVFDWQTNSFWYYDFPDGWKEIAGMDSRVFTKTSGVIHSAQDLATDDFVFGSDQLNGTNDTLFFFDKSKGAFRMGRISDSFWQADSLGQYSFAVGDGPLAKGDHSVAMGYRTRAEGNTALAIGYASQAIKDGTIALGNSSKAEKINAVAIGRNANAKDTSAISLGHNTIAAKPYSMALGNAVSASGRNATAMGYENDAHSAYETVIGLYNESYTPFETEIWDYRDRLFVVGNGTSPSNRRNALTLFKNGHLGLGTSEAPHQLTISNSLALPKTTASDTGVIYLGEERFIHNYDNERLLGGNTFVGEKAGNFTLGTGGLTYSGSGNTGIGKQVMKDVSEGYFNTGVGSGALFNLNTGKMNVGIGYQALFETEYSMYNVAIGSFTMFDNVNGEANVAIGYSAFLNKTSSHQNTVVGHRAGYGSTNEQNYGNCFFGYEAGDTLTSGDYNILLGYKAGDNVTSGSRNIIIGNELNTSASDTDDQLMIGGVIYGQLDEKRIGINTDSPQKTLHLVGNDTLGSVLICPNENGSGDDASLILAEDNDGTFGMELKYDGNSNQLKIYGKTNSGLNGPHFNINRTDGNIGIGTDDPGSKLHVVGNEILSTGANCGFKFRERESSSPLDDWVWYASSDYARLFENGTGDIMVIKNNGLVGIGRVPTANRLEVNGNASKNVAGDWLTNSDSRLKKNINQLEGEETLQKVLALRGVNFEWNDNQTGYDRPEGVQFGLIAQDVEQVFPDFVSRDDKGFLQTSYGTYDAMYIESIRALNNKIDTLELENAELKSKLDDLDEIKSKMSRLEEKLEALLINSDIQ